MKKKGNKRKSCAKTGPRTLAYPVEFRLHIVKLFLIRWRRIHGHLTTFSVPTKIKSGILSRVDLLIGFCQNIGRLGIGSGSLWQIPMIYKDQSQKKVERYLVGETAKNHTSNIYYTTDGEREKV